MAEQLCPVMEAGAGSPGAHAATSGFHLLHEAVTKHMAPRNHMPCVFSAFSVFLARPPP